MIIFFFLEMHKRGGVCPFAAYRQALQITNQQKCLPTKFSWRLSDLSLGMPILG